ncbi:hypothetical protein CG716_25150 [Mycolicibacterium sphagni]|uniref:Uncharacterized protein n=2 Tax=Mycolicibacterium sphagni TaxID=1786 RepID=A0A255DE36_9MYCO|nr:hypothetical protein [Mycolicibacterium sphagni]OYN75505.1 hypothetical protein CG716_25150 [Mycolicibacterium sphagni]
MRTFVVGVVGVCGVLAAEAASLLMPERHAMSWFSGVALALALVAVRWSLGRRPTPGPADGGQDQAGMTIRRWVERAESQIAWSDSTRADWDRRLRPSLARQFEIATRQPRSRNPAAFANTGRILFGDDLWRWVDPDNISRTGAQERGPGRAVFVHIIERLERL